MSMNSECFDRCHQDSSLIWPVDQVTEPMVLKIIILIDNPSDKYWNFPLTFAIFLWPLPYFQGALNLGWFLREKNMIDTSSTPAIKTFLELFVEKRKIRKERTGKKKKEKTKTISFTMLGPVSHTFWVDAFPGMYTFILMYKVLITEVGICAWLIKHLPCLHISVSHCQNVKTHI